MQKVLNASVLSQKFVHKLLVSILVLLIRVYQFLFSFDHAFWAKWVNYRVCIYEPSCSEYTVQALKKYGLFKGAWMGAKRVASCHPGNPGGLDPVP